MERVRRRVTVWYEASGSALARAEPRVARQSAAGLGAIVPYLLAMPLVAVFFVFFSVPIFFVVVGSFFCLGNHPLLVPRFTLQKSPQVFSASFSSPPLLI